MHCKPLKLVTLVINVMIPTTMELSEKNGCGRENKNIKKHLFCVRLVLIIIIYNY